MPKSVKCLKEKKNEIEKRVGRKKNGHVPYFSKYMLFKNERLLNMVIDEEIIIL
jgi:hypothetical protein